MAGLSVRVRCDLQPFEDKLDRLVEMDFAGLHRKLGNVVLNDTLDAFRKGQSPFGEKWKVSGRVVAAGGRRKRLGERPAGKTLVDTGRLRASLHVAADQDSAEVGTDLIYARIHQFGGETGRRGARFDMPARPYMPIDENGEMAPKTRETLEKTIAHHIQERLL